MFTRYENALGQGVTVEVIIPEVQAAQRTQFASEKVIRQEFGQMSKVGQAAQIAAGVVFPLHAINMKLPVIGDVFNSIIGGIFKKATKMESCMKWWTYSNLYNIGPSDVIPINVDEMMKKLPVQYQFSYDIIKRNLVGLFDKAGRLNRARAIFVNLAYANSDIFQAQCVAQHRDETGAPPEMLAQVGRVWDAMREVAKQQEYNQTFDEFEKKVEGLVSSMVAVSERGKVYKKAITAGKIVVDPTKPTFKYTPSGIPLAVVGDLPCCCHRRFPNE